MKPRTIEHIDVFPTRLPVVKTFEFASGSAGTAGGTAPHVFVQVTDSEGETGWGEGRVGHGRARPLCAGLRDVVAKLPGRQ